MDEWGLCSHRFLPTLALVDLGLAALRDFAPLIFTASLSFPAQKNDARRSGGRRRLEATHATGAFDTP